MARPVYWIVVWGDRVYDETRRPIPTSGPNDRPGSARQTYEKHADYAEACKECWGFCDDSMWLKDLGGSKKYASAKVRAEQWDRDKGYWFRVSGDFYWKDGKLVKE